jgi:AraC-like DNA-binding protein
MLEFPKEMIKPIDFLYEDTYSEGSKAHRSHPYYEMIYIVEGQAQFQVGTKVYDIKPNSIVFINNLEFHKLNITSYPYRRFFILIKPSYLYSIINDPILLSIFKHRPAHFQHMIVLGPTEKESIFKTYKDIMTEKARQLPFWETALGAYLQLILITLFREYRDYFPNAVLTSSMTTILAVQKHIEENYLEPISLVEVAKQFYLDQSYLSRLFKRLTGFTFSEYIILQRINHAKELLLFSSQDTTQVGINSGYNNVNHFIRIFKKYEGITPYQYRSQSRESKKKD